MKDLMMWADRHKKVLVVALVIGGAVVWYFGGSSGDTDATAIVKTVRVERGDLRIAVSGSGQIEAVSQVDLQPVIAGDGIDVVSVWVKNNQAVKKNQVIATLDTGDAVRDIASAELDLESALLKQKQTDDQYDRETKEDRWNRQTQEISVKQRRIALAEAREKLADYSIREPFDGIVTGLDVEAGDSVSRETVIASVITSDMKVVITLNEVDAAKVTEGARTVLTLDALPEMEVSGKISKIATIGTISSNVVSYEAEIELDQQHASLKPGMSVSAEIVVAEREDVVLVPNAALTVKEGRTTVKKTGKDTSVSTVEGVKTGLTDDAMTEITSGLSEGESVILPSVSATKTTATQSTGILSSLFRGTGSNRR